MGDPNFQPMDVSLTDVITREIRKQINESVKEFDWNETIIEFISDIAQDVLDSAKIKGAVRACIIDTLSKDDKFIVGLAHKAIKQMKT